MRIKRKQASNVIEFVISELIGDMAVNINNTISVYGDTVGRIVESFANSSNTTETRVVDSSSGVVIDWTF